MRRRNLTQPRSRSAGCPPGCRLPCCNPRRRRQTKPNRCVFVPPPALTTKRYCGDPCSPPPPGCTPKPIFGRSGSQPRKPRATLRCDPCEPRQRPLSNCSPRSYGRPFRPYSTLYCSTTPCRPKRCGPLDPCVPSLTDRCEPCVPRLSCDPCTSIINRYSSPVCYQGNNCATTCRKPRKPRRCGTPKRRRRRCRRSSSCGSSYCESSYSRAGRCQVCKCDPCCCVEKGGHEELVKGTSNEDTSKGPTSWFLKKSEKCGKNKSPNDPHFCPWEAEVKVTGTVRGHCTSTAVEVAKRLTGKFSSKGQRYTTCKKEPTCEPENCRPQKMTLGCLDDGTKLNFSRNRCEDEDEDALRNKESYFKGRTNNAITDGSASANRWRSCWDEVKVRERKRSGREELTFATAYVGGKNSESRSRYTNNIEDGPQDGVYTLSHKGFSDRAVEASDHRARHPRGNRQSQAHGRNYSVASDSDQSSYRTASETMQDRVWHTSSRRHPSSPRDAEDVHHSRRKSHRKAVDSYRDNNRLSHNSYSGGTREEWWRRQPYYHRTNVESNNYCSNDEDFNNESDNDDDYDGFDYVNGDGESDNDDIDEVYPHFSPLPRRLAIADRRASSSDRRYLSPVNYSRRSTHSPVQHRNGHRSRTSGAAKHRPDSAYLDQEAYSGQSSDGGMGEGRYTKSRDRQKWEMAHHSRHSNHRRRVTYGEG